MKHILSTLIFVLVFFLSFFFLLRPSPALADETPVQCAFVKANTNASVVLPTCHPKGVETNMNALIPECSKGQSPCPENQVLCAQNIGPALLNQIGCWPKTQASPVGLIFKDSACRDGFGRPSIFAGCDAINQAFGAAKCCKTGWNGECEEKSTSLEICNPDRYTFAPMDRCGESNWNYNSVFNLCEQFAETTWDAKKTCLDGKGVETGIGCIPVDNLQGFLEFVLKWAFFASGGIIVLMVVATGYTLLTSQGNPEKLQAAKENIVALFSGLILIAFSLVLLQTIGADVLKLPTFITP